MTGRRCRNQTGAVFLIWKKGHRESMISASYFVPDACRFHAPDALPAPPVSDHVSDRCALDFVAWVEVALKVMVNFFEISGTTPNPFLPQSAENCAAGVVETTGWQS